MIRNPDFSETGAQLGGAADWRLRSHVSRVRIAGFGPSPHLGSEDFERWSTLLISFSAQTQAFWRPTNTDAEAFSAGWSNDAFLVAWPSGRSVQAVFEGQGVEEFRWADLRRVWSQIPSRVGIVELFERGWRSDKIFTLWSSIPSAPANSFPETFDHAAWPPL